MAYFSLIQQLKEQVSLVLDNYIVISEKGTEDESRPAEWPDIKWWGMFQALFVNNAMSSYWTDEDDMLFAVFRNPAGKTPFMAIRRDPGVLPNELMYGSDMYNSIDWKATVLLNMAMHARFRLTLTVGGHEDILAALQSGAISPQGCTTPTHRSSASQKLLQRRTFNIHPRLSRIPVDSSGRYVKVSEPDNTFPYLAFSVDDFDDEAIEPLVLQEPTDEFAVLLHAEAWPPEPPERAPQPAPQATSGPPAAAAPPAVAHGQPEAPPSSGDQEKLLAPEASTPASPPSTPRSSGTKADTAFLAAPAACGADPAAPAAAAAAHGTSGCTSEGRPAVCTPDAAAGTAPAVDDVGRRSVGSGARADSGHRGAHPTARQRLLCEGASAGAGDESPAGDWRPSDGSGAGPTHVCMFRGYVDHGQVHDTIRRRQPSRRLSSLIPTFRASPDKARPGDPPKPPRPQSFFIRMNGPRGRGRAEVAVSPRPATTGTPSGENPDTLLYPAAGTDASHGARGDVGRGEGAGGNGVDGTTVEKGEGPPGSAGSRDGGVGSGKPPRRTAEQQGLLGHFMRAARAVGRAVRLDDEAAAREVAQAPQFECRFICLMLAVEDVVTTLLGLHAV